MEKKVKRPEDMTWSDIRATFASAARLSEKNEKTLDRLEKSVDRAVTEMRESGKRMEASVDKSVTEMRESGKRMEASVDKSVTEMRESGKRMEATTAKLEVNSAELKAIVAETSKVVAKTSEGINELRRELGGISRSNNLMSEGFLYESLDAVKTLGGIHYDVVVEDMHLMKKLKDGSILRGQYDAVMINDDAICIVEVKYRLRRKDVEDFVNTHVNTFKILYPQYEGYKFYLAVGGLAFEKGAMDAARRLGVAIIKSKGGALKIFDDNLKVY